MRCTFDEGDCCRILTQRRCGKCKFRKTEMEFTQAQITTKQRLQRMGLIKVKRPSPDGWGDIITVEEGFDED